MRVWIALSLAALTGCASVGSAERVTYDLSSPDVGVAWHLHGKDGSLLCELPCSAPLGADSGAWLGVHDPKKSWRLDIPAELPAPAGSRVFATARVGKGTPALGTLGYILGVSGATSAVAGAALLVASLVSLSEGCLPTGSSSSCGDVDQATTFATIGAPMLAGGAVLGVIGYWLLDHNRAPTLRILPTGVVGTFE